MRVGDVVQVYIPKAMGRIGIVEKIKGDKAEVSIWGIGTVLAPLENIIEATTKQALKDIQRVSEELGLYDEDEDDPDEIQWIRRRD